MNNRPNYKKRMQQYFKSCFLPQEYELKQDEINGKTFAVGKVNNEGVLEPLSNYYSPKEMSAYLFGIIHSKTGKY